MTTATINSTLDKYIYSSIDDDIRPTTSDDDRILVWHILKQNRDKFCTAKVLSKFCGYTSLNNSVKLRKVITELIEFHHVPIFATVKGFKLAENAEEVHTYKASLVARRKGLDRRIKSVEKVIRLIGGEFP